MDPQSRRLWKLQILSFLCVVTAIIFTKSGLLPFISGERSFGYLVGGYLVVGALSSWGKILIVRRLKTTPFANERYAEEINDRSEATCWILGIFLISVLNSGEYIATGLIGALMIVIFGFAWLTTVRTEQGWFADNRHEVLELLNFIISKSKYGDFPPGSRVSRRSLEAIQLRTSSSEEAAGSRA